MREKKYKTFQEFWPFYVSEHAHPLNRKLHFIGTALALLALLRALILRKPKQLWLAPFLGYFFAWIGHFVVEKNRPATFTYPLESLRGDFKMFGLILRGKMEAELEKAEVLQHADR